MRRKENKSSLLVIGGKGKMGKLFTRFFVDSGFVSRVEIYDKDSKKILKNALKEKNLILVSVPISISVKMIEEVVTTLKSLNSNATIVDITSLKEKQTAELSKHENFLSLHPMFGDSVLTLRGQTIICCGKRGDLADKVLNNFKSLGAKIITLSSKRHDQMMNLAQGLIHFSEIAFAGALRNCKIKPKELLKYTGKASELKLLMSARLLNQDERLYGDIQILNPYKEFALNAYKKAVNDLAEIIEREDKEAFEKYFVLARKNLGSYSKEAYEDGVKILNNFIELKEKENLSNDESLNFNKPAIVTLGPEGSFSSYCTKHFIEKYNLNLPIIYASTVPEIFYLLRENKRLYALAPVENRLEGTVRETLDAIFFNDFIIQTELVYKVEQSLIGIKSAKKRDILTIYSHPQALAQCSNFLHKNFPKASLVSMSSTSSALKKISQDADPTQASIGFAKSTSLYNNLDVLVKKADDHKENRTTFLFISHAKSKPLASFEQKNKTTIAFYFAKNKPGSLKSVFDVFANAGVNISRIESRPAKKDLSEYVFHLDFEGSTKDPKVLKLLSQIKKCVATFKLVGSY